ncbi:MAG: dihydroneopterin aldolase [Sphaerochaeta sp.]|nr:dihydroneopterin aldolase [Sphaerochaeta sp.]
MDKILIEDLQVYAYHGVAQAEKTNGQMFFVSLQLGLDLEQAGIQDDLHLTISYAQVCKDVQNVLQDRTYNLIEAATMSIIEFLFHTYPTISEIFIQLKKPWAPMGQHLKYAAVEMNRKREDRDEW